MSRVAADLSDDAEVAKHPSATADAKARLAPPRRAASGTWRAVEEKYEKMMAGRSLADDGAACPIGTRAAMRDKRGAPLGMADQCEGFFVCYFEKYGAAHTDDFCELSKLSKVRQAVQPQTEPQLLDPNRLDAPDGESRPCNTER